MATFINTAEWRIEETRKAILQVLEGIDREHAKTASAIAEELREILPFTVTVQGVSANIGYMHRSHRNIRILRNEMGWFDLVSKANNEEVIF